MAPASRHEWENVARALSMSIGREVLLSRTNLALTCRRPAKLAGVSPSTQQRVERGDPSVGIATACRVAAAVGLKVWAKAFPVRTPSLRDTGQLRIAEMLRHAAHVAYRVAIELALADGRSADEVFFGPDEIIHAEIERLLADWQAQYRSAAAKRDELAAAHQRPVRLVLVIEDTRSNRAAIRPHETLIRSTLPAGSREVMRALRSGQRLGRDGILWIRPRNDRHIGHS
jgi:transcriptional regulator with XRE-family HTH domain